MSSTIYCSICLDVVPTDNIYITECNHEFCIKCLFGYLHHDKFRNVKTIPCPLCRANIIEILRNPPKKYNMFIMVICCLCK